MSGGPPNQDSKKNPSAPSNAPRSTCGPARQGNRLRRSMAQLVGMVERLGFYYLSISLPTHRWN